MKVYIAGPFKHVDEGDDYRSRQRELLERAGHQVVDPTSSDSVGDFRGVWQWPEVVVETVGGDLKAILDSDLLLLNAQRSSTGTGQEALWAAFFGRPVVLVAHYARGVDPSEVSPWALFVADRVLDMFTEEAARDLATVRRCSLFHRFVSAGPGALRELEVAQGAPLPPSMEAWVAGLQALKPSAGPEERALSLQQHLRAWKEQLREG
jgi:nucleoside 2-deoxyribosyltransferase